MTAARRIFRIHQVGLIQDEIQAFFDERLPGELTQQIVEQCVDAARRQRRRSWRGIFRRMAFGDGR
jgi:hypothetical protein